MAVGRDSQETGFRAGGFSLAPPRFVTRSRPIFLRVRTPRFPGGSAVKTPTNSLKAGFSL